MGCFLACFGFSNRRRSDHYNLISADQSHGSSKLLEYNSEEDIHDPPNPSIPDSIISNEDVNRCDAALKKRVTFCSNVRTFEPLQNEDCTSQVSEIEENKTDKGEEKVSSGMDSFISKMNTYPSNYRYQNLRDNWNEEDEETDEMWDDDDDDDDDEDDIKEINEEDSDNELYFSQLESEDEEEENKVETNNRNSQYKCPVLLPVENITQWRKMKAKHKRSAKVSTESKENLQLEIIDQNGHDETGKPRFGREPESNWNAQMLNMEVDDSLSYSTTLC